MRHGTGEGRARGVFEGGGVRVRGLSVGDGGLSLAGGRGREGGDDQWMPHWASRASRTLEHAAAGDVGYWGPGGRGPDERGSTPSHAGTASGWKTASHQRSGRPYASMEVSPTDRISLRGGSAPMQQRDGRGVGVGESSKGRAGPLGGARAEGEWQWEVREDPELKCLFYFLLVRVWKFQ